MIDRVALVPAVLLVLKEVGVMKQMPMQRQPKLQPPEPLGGRSCGSCQLCCEVMSVPDLSVTDVKCEHQCAGGCAIYQDRPELCVGFQCLWLRGVYGDLTQRPDRVGFVLLDGKEEQPRDESGWPWSRSRPGIARLRLLPPIRASKP